MPGCPACGRPVAVARASCLYCGAALPEALRPAPVSAAQKPADSPAEVIADRSLLVLELTNVTAESLAALTGQSPWDASRLVKRGGLHLHRLLEPAVAEDLAASFRAAAIGAWVVPEKEARLPPLCASRGERSGEQLLLDTAEGRIALGAAELLLVVSGPIAREPGPRLERRRFDSVRLHDSWCAHLHRGADPRPLELDPRRIELGFTVTGSTQLELESWVEALGREVPRDDGFRREAPALAPPPATEEGRSVAWPFGVARPTARPGFGSEPPPVYDNLAQFRFYSGWRAAVERRRAGSRAQHGAC